MSLSTLDSADLHTGSEDHNSLEDQLKGSLILKTIPYSFWIWVKEKEWRN